MPNTASAKPAAKKAATKTPAKKTAAKAATKKEVPTEPQAKQYITSGNELYFAKVRPDAIIPTKRDEDAGYDFYANFPEDNMVIDPHCTKAIPSGIATCFSSDYYMQVHERGSTGKIGMKYSAGVFDSGYRGEHFIMLTNTNDRPIVISKLGTEQLGKAFYVGDKKYKTADCIIYPYSKAICQEVVLPVPKMNIQEISYEELSQIPSQRKAGLTGSSGK